MAHDLANSAPRHWMRWDEDEQRGFSYAVAISLVGHVVLFGLLTFAPAPVPLHAPASISVRLVAAPPSHDEELFDITTRG